MCRSTSPRRGSHSSWTPSKGLLNAFVDLNNRVLDHFSPEEQTRIGVHTCPGGDRDATHSAEVDYAELLPTLFTLRAGNFYIQLASEKDRERVLRIIQHHSRSNQRIFIGVIDPINPRVETPERAIQRRRVDRCAAKSEDFAGSVVGRK
jgi:5-methyltetrahydropteroyltriglutamate--homocysteine methyltransferase